MTSPLFSIIRDIIGNEGPISVERYMELVLHHPQYGYYRQHNPLGKTGDFITAPELTQLFGEMLAVWVVELWNQLGKPDPFILLELGPGRGTMLQDLLKATERVTEFQKALRLYILESNETLRALQSEKLAAYKPVYLEDLRHMPRLPLIALANEFFDTIPRRQFVYVGGAWHERLVDYIGEKLVFVEGDAQPDRMPEHLADFVKEGWFYEVSPSSLVMLKVISEHIVQNGGVGLIVDYGYGVPAGENTLFALRQHKHIDPLEFPDDADVTGDVDFSALKAIALHSGAKVVGPLAQEAFLHALGIGMRVKQLKHYASDEVKQKIEEDYQKLVDPARMGSMFKAMAIVSASIKDVPGF